MTKYEEGLKIVTEIDGRAGEEVFEALADIAPEVNNYMIEFVFGEIYAREGLSHREQEMITLTTFLTQGNTAGQIKVHVHAALNVGLTKEEIIGVFIHCIPFVGFPKVLNAIYVAKEVFKNELD